MKYAIYIRVSTQKQGQSGLGLEAQMDICRNYINSVNGELSGTFKDVESGTHRKRPELLKALEFCKKNDCTLVIAKLDRLARDIEFTFKVVNSGVQIYFCDMPVINTLMLGIFATVAQYERELISKRTKDALAAKKKQGIKLGAPYISEETRHKAGAAAAKRHIDDAKNNSVNKIVWGLVKDVDTPEGMKKTVELLNQMQVKTTTGLDFNIQRLYALRKRLVDRMKGGVADG